MANQRFGAGWAAAEGFEHVCRGATPAEAEHGVAEAGSGFANPILLI
jgi:hypothetical protein